METFVLSPLTDQLRSPSGCVYRAGDLVAPVKGYPILYEIVCLETDCRVRVRGLEWPRGYTVVLDVEEVQPTSYILRANC